MEFKRMMEKAGVDVETTLYRFGGNEGLWSKFVKKFADEETYVNLEQAVQSGRLKEIEGLGHTLKGVSANLGFQRISDLCNDLVWDVRNGATDQIGEDFKELSEEYKKIVDIIREL